MKEAEGGGREASLGVQHAFKSRGDMQRQCPPPAQPLANGPSTLPANSRLADLACPVLLMNLPLSLSAAIANNVYMEELGSSRREICRDTALDQFRALYRHVTQHAVVYLLPSSPGLQDQPYVSNLGLTLPHLDNETVIIARFRSAPRVGEERVGAEFFRLMNFAVAEPPETYGGEPLYFEGEADLKHLTGNIYVGAHGMRTSRNALTWAAERHGMDIIPFHVTNPYLYHLDCCLLPLDEETVLLCAAGAEEPAVRAIGRHCEIIDVSLAEARAGITNCLLLPGEIVCDSNIAELGKDNAKYPAEKAKIERLEHICARFGRDLHVFSMSEFYKSGALLSCLVMHIKHAGRGRRQEIGNGRNGEQHAPLVSVQKPNAV